MDRKLIESFESIVNREKLTCIVHSIPPNLSIEKLKTFINQLKEKVGTLFLTDLDVEYYHNFYPRFADFVDAVMSDA